jgi:hypothetical protein
VHLLARSCRLAEKWSGRRARQESEDGADSSCRPHCGRCSPRLPT